MDETPGNEGERGPLRIGPGGVSARATPTMAAVQLDGRTLQAIIAGAAASHTGNQSGSSPPSPQVVAGRWRPITGIGTMHQGESQNSQEVHERVLLKGYRGQSSMSSIRASCGSAEPAHKAKGYIAQGQVREDRAGDPV